MSADDKTKDQIRSAHQEAVSNGVASAPQRFEMTSEDLVDFVNGLHGAIENLDDALLALQGAGRETEVYRLLHDRRDELLSLSIRLKPSIAL